MVFSLIQMLLAGVGLFIIIFMYFLLKKSPAHWPPRSKSTGLLPHDFFMTLMFLLTMWLVIFMLYATKDFPWAQKQNFVIAASLVSPFLVWWWNKQFGNKK